MTRAQIQRFRTMKTGSGLLKRRGKDEIVNSTRINVLYDARRAQPGFGLKCSSLVGNDVLPLTRIGPRHNRDNRFGGADIEDFMRDARLDEDEIAGSVLDDLPKAVAV